MKIVPAQREWASWIASRIMEAMNHECCLNLAGPKHGLADFHQLMTDLVERTDTQYSYLNSLVALSDEGELMGTCVSYDGAALLRLRKPFIEESLKRFGMDHSHMTPETQAGELYADSLCIDHNFRHRGVGSALLKATIEKGRRLMLPKVGLLVDKGNPKAEHLYHQLGFEYVNDTEWGGHPMRHLQYDLQSH
ncbi:MAG: GNAT family N-acetyltransferase [Prevotella sp.]|jgi:DNA-3-methyladenine glycosylase I